MILNIKRREKILKDHPNLYKQYIYFDCGNGWLDIIEQLSNDIEKLIVKDLSTFTDEFFIPQCIEVKEKFGQLRFYMTIETAEMHELIENAIEKSQNTCEKCGERGRFTNIGWYKTRCKKHELE